VPPEAARSESGLAATGLPENTLMFCGTLATRGVVRPATRFEFEIEDPALGRKISHSYIWQVRFVRQNFKMSHYLARRPVAGQAGCRMKYEASMSRCRGKNGAGAGKWIGVAKRDD
jgi:Protein of unknown function (DUF2848)